MITRGWLLWICSISAVWLGKYRWKLRESKAMIEFKRKDFGYTDVYWDEEKAEEMIDYCRVRWF